ncbi:ArsR/SmtB family transcription factor [Glycomyces dulcitolivorans]|uniref:ArsR/SmtB family transcription factor n=1 Tax=Glycomyces dulcitolivorans TaxID=2200759 RepID=UPI000DD346D9|nr:winged helix-turn-helix domain-containing protein [Glycomyces dulcitolivorans]
MTDRAQGAKLAEVAALLADPTRATFCVAMLDGRAWTAGELARRAGVAASTATEHLHRLTASGLCVERRQGRHRYVQLADPETAALIESLAGHFPVAEAPAGLRASTASAALARGRTCYDHLAGRLGVAVTDAMTGLGLLDRTAGFALSDKGRDWMETALGVDTAGWSHSRRTAAKECLDWTERRSHLAGLAGAAVCDRFLESGWVRRVGSTRAVRLTDSGATALQELLDMDAGPLR